MAEPLTDSWKTTQEATGTWVKENDVAADSWVKVN